MRFAHALTIVRAIPQNSTLQPVTADKLQFYGLYKQATEGDVNIPRPSSRQVVEYAKWYDERRMNLARDRILIVFYLLIGKCGVV